ncbi:MAG: NAD(P)-binding domain-containing protein [Conexivisphaera sp.]
MRIGFAGLGLMGSRIAARLSGPGIELLLWDRTSSRARDVSSKVPGSRTGFTLRTHR